MPTEQNSNEPVVIIYNIVSKLRDRSGRTYADAMALMSERLKYDYVEDQFNKRFRQKQLSERGTPRYQQDEIEALIYAYTHELTEEKRCRASEAFELFDAARISFTEWKTLKDKKFFTNEQYNKALSEYMQQHGISELTPEEDLFYRLRPERHRIIVGRQVDTREVKTRLGTYDKTQRQSFLIIRGWPGVGKTAFINELVHDQALEKAFQYGVMWMSLGKEGDVFTALRKWAEQLGAVHLAQKNDIDLLDGLRHVLRGKEILLIADDVWTPEMGKTLKKVVNFETNALLMTTRFTDVAKILEDQLGENQIYVLEALSEKHSLELLEILAREPVKQYRDKMSDLSTTLEGLPLAIQVAGRLMDFRDKANLDVEPLINELINNYNTLLNEGDPNRVDEETGQTPTIALLFKRSVETLTSDGQLAFVSLGVTRRKPATFSLETIKAVWEIASPEHLILDLVGRGLLEATKDRRFVMHQTLHMYANKLLDQYDETGELAL